jgi:hypothetical protein
MKFLHITNMHGDEVFIGRRIATTTTPRGEVFPKGVQVLYTGTNVNAIANPRYMKDKRREELMKAARINDRMISRIFHATNPLIVSDP